MLVHASSECCNQVNTFYVNGDCKIARSLRGPCEGTTDHKRKVGTQKSRVTDGRAVINTVKINGLNIWKECIKAEY